VEIEVMGSGYGGDGGGSPSVCGSHVSPIFLPYIHEYKCKKIFYDTMKYKKMNEGIFLKKNYTSMVNISYRVFTLHKNYLHGA